jgi:GNAT superfamily N-acetyltransferase
MSVRISEVVDGTPEYEALLMTAGELDQVKYVSGGKPHHLESMLLGAFDGDSCVGFLRVVVQTIGSEERRTPVRGPDGSPLTEGFAEAFGVLPHRRRQGIGRRLQEMAIALCRARGCYQLRSKSPISSRENYGLKLKMGYGIHPDVEYDAYYFTLAL